MDLYDLKYDYDSSCLFFEDNEDILNIYAHENELFHCHILKTKFVFNNLMEDDVIKKFYHNFKEENYISVNFEDFKLILEDFIFFHDVGKLSFSFQKRLNNDSIIWDNQFNFLMKFNFDNIIDNFEANHSLFGALSFIAKYHQILEENCLFIIILAYSILGHHTSLKDILNEEGFAYNSFSGKDINTISCLLLFLKIATLDEIEKGNFNQRYFQSIQDIANSNKLLDSSYFSFFYNYIYSLLISADVIASREFDKNLDDIKKSNYSNRINEGLQIKMNNSFFSIEYNENINNEIFSQEVNKINDINCLRKNMLLESSYNLNSILKNSMLNDKHVFFLNMPTGAGKTNTSMKLALDLINNTGANRIIYAMPFISIIEQNYDIIKNSFNLNEDNSEIRKIYSATETIFDKDDSFKSKIILQDDFFNYPVICTTFSTFFDSILRTRKRNKYKMSSFANSVVILDEVQSLPLLNWNSLYYIINEISKQYNIYFIIMSATLPKFNKLKINDDLIHDDPLLLIERPEVYFDHYLFDRTIIRDSIKEFSINDCDELEKYLMESIIRPNFNNGYNKGLIVLNTIRSSRLIYEVLSKYDDFDVDLLNSSLLPSVKQKIIYKINNMDNESKKYILISTQTIEAGVDVSFDFVIRDFATLDSIEQVRGRCNRSRELNKNDPYKKGNVYLIKLKNKSKNLFEYIYNDYELNSRIYETEKLFEKNMNYKYLDILEYYDNISNNINNMEDEKNQQRFFNDRDNIVRWNNFEYSKLNEDDGIHIIDNKFMKYSIFIPTNIKIFVNQLDEYFNFEKSSDKELMRIYNENKDKFIFSFNELKFLKFHFNHSDYNFINSNYIIGEEFIKYYERILNNIDDFNGFKIIKKEFSSILNKFLINVSINNEEVQDKVICDFKKIDYFYILDKEYLGDDEESLYSIEKGLNDYPHIVEIL